ncbi:GNAT family N-acetyltransferase [uncultured Phenylobacterium sp.]|uniref:GNAT family N-acetyltransferase n=1 Tax=uncultured Phenylobacterium sp. TaxID=349273 RepID=UPI0026005A1F|nr:GNAT family N-acetyltransferase [uncultured Phenylobacterium sp.]
MGLRIVDFSQLTAAQRVQAAHVLEAAFAHLPAAFDGAFAEEVQTFFTELGRAAWAALDGDAVVGWVGRIEGYEYAWELHPLAVHPAAQRRGVGSALVALLEERARAAGMLTVYLGTDDEFDGTNLFGQELFPDVAGKIAGVVETNGHPFAFYRKLGYEITGLVPHANGFGKPDILMAKRL